MKNLRILFSILFVLLGCRLEKDELPPPNIVWLISEDNSPFLGCYGDEFATTPNLDKLAQIGVKFTNAFANAPVCAPSRSTLISGMYATTMGTQHMRSENPTPKFMKFFPYYLKKVGYYTTNRIKKDYNTIDQDSIWDNSDWWGWKDAFIGREKDQPFFMMYNTWMSHEGKIHPNTDDWQYFHGTMKDHNIDSTTYQSWWDDAKHNPELVLIPPYHPKTKEMMRDWARYYDCVELMDKEIGVVIEKLKQEKLLENTIIFYFSDHGGVIARSKRFVFDSGLRVPMLIYFPEKYQNLVDYKMGSETDRVVSFVDLAPTVLSLVGIEVPDYFEGEAFAGKHAKDEKEYAFGFRGRMDERYDLVRTVRDKHLRYIRNYMPHRIYGGKVKYLWRAKSIQSWEAEFKKGTLDETQSAFWQTKAVEELYDIHNDPQNINNLADDPKYREDLLRLRNILQKHINDTRDLGFIPEAEMVRRYKHSTPYNFIRSENFPFDRVMETANLATVGNSENLKLLIDRLSDQEPVVRYWAAIGCAILKDKAISATRDLINLLADESTSVRIAASEALYNLNEKEKSIKTLLEIINLPEMGKEETPRNIGLYSSHFAITLALNVVDALNIDTEEIRKAVKRIATSERAGMRDYDKRMAEDLALKFGICIP